jgi:hypothetical protein
MTEETQNSPKSEMDDAIDELFTLMDIYRAQRIQSIIESKRSWNRYAAKWRPDLLDLSDDPPDI